MSRDKQLVIHTDGGARGNPGPSGAGWVIADIKGNTLKKGAAFLGEQTNNYAEYEAVIRALTDLKKLVPKTERKDIEIELYLDSELVARQLLGEYQVKDEPLQLQYMRIHNMRVSEFPKITITHVRRAENSVADKLANEAMDGGTGTLL